MIKINKIHVKICMLVLMLGLTGCTSFNLNKVMTSTKPSVFSEDEIQILNGTEQYFDHCSIGVGLQDKSIDVILANKEHIRMIMSGSSALAELYFPQFEDAIRVIGAPSLLSLEKKGSRASLDNVPYEVLAYGLEANRGTPEEEWQDIQDSVQQAKIISDEYKKLLIVAPGFQLMEGNEELYTPLAALVDIWVLQTQQLQKNPPGADYKHEVERIVNLIRSGNSDIEIWAQITFPPDREPNAQEWLEYYQSIIDFIDGAYIGIYIWDVFDEAQIISTIQAIFNATCMNNP